VNWAALDVSLLGPAFLAGLLVLATHVPLGIQVLKRGIVFIDLAIAQIAALGVIVAGVLDLGTQGIAAQAAAVLAALAGALFLTWTERRWPEVQEAIIGVLFVVTACLGLLLLANNPHGGEHLKDLLAGQILWVGKGQLAMAAVVSGLVLGLWLWRSDRAGRRLGFYVLFAFAVTQSVQLVGVYLVFASLIVPALAVRRLARRQLAWGWGLGAMAYGLGLMLSALLDWPSGAVIVLALVAVALLLPKPAGPAPS
jgi:zinc/manganese transport system permease protein